MQHFQRFLSTQNNEDRNLRMLVLVKNYKLNDNSNNRNLFN